MKNVKKYSLAAEASMILLNLAEKGEYEGGRGRTQKASWIGIWSDGTNVAAVPIGTGIRHPLIALGFDELLGQTFLGTKMVGRPISSAKSVLEMADEYNRKSRETGSGGFITKVVDYTTGGTIHELSI